MTHTKEDLFQPKQDFPLTAKSEDGYIVLRTEPIIGVIGIWLCVLQH